MPDWVVAVIVTVGGCLIAVEDRHATVVGLCLAMGGTMYIVGRLLIHYIAREYGAPLRALRPPPRADRPVRPEAPSDA